jgi:leader peptidase (prepilin peptidase)/N-methyltransferase
MLADIVAVLCLLGAAILLGVLTAVDLRERLLPDIYVFPFMALGPVFHFANAFALAAPADMALGALAGGGLLYAIRTAANLFHEEDALGLGDVKLMAAAGVWLGPYFVLIALTLGALAGVLHGLAVAARRRVKSGAWMNLKNFSLPAGPGFIAGIVLAGLIGFWDKTLP